MQHGVSAIHCTRAGNRFVLPATQQRERRLGLHGVFRTSSGPVPTPLASATGQPLRALRSATRGAVSAAPTPRGSTGAILRTETGPHWAPARARLHDSRIAGPSPWWE
jgi:hypothetical protein